MTFSLEEQRNSVVDGDAAATVVEIKAGHIEIVGDNRVAPEKLTAILQKNGVIRPTVPERMTAFNLLLAKLYGDNGSASPLEPLRRDSANDYAAGGGRDSDRRE